MNKFKPGDRVKVLESSLLLWRHGEEGVVSSVDPSYTDDGDVATVTMDDRNVASFYVKNLEILEPKSEPEAPHHAAARQRTVEEEEFLIGRQADTLSLDADRWPEVDSTWVKDAFGLPQEYRVLDAERQSTPGFQVKDSGAREEYASGMVRDTEAGKPRFDLILPEGVPFESQFLTRIASHMTKGIAKYGPRNWEKAEGKEEYERFKRSAQRHLMQWLCGDRDEDHAAAVFFNLLAAETVKYRMDLKAEDTSAILEALDV